MAEITPVVYDIAQPTPIPLKDLSAIAVSMEIWRNDIRKRRMNGTISRFLPLGYHFSAISVLVPDLPPVIYDAVDKFVLRFGPSATTWLCSEFRTIFQPYRADRNSILEVFDDFVADYSGTVDYARTAKRMMVCDRLSEVEKFAIACTYFFEDDIRRIWPSVCQSFGLNSMDFSKCPQLYYWICFLKNQLSEIPIHEGRSVDEVMLGHHMRHNRPSLEYFWNRVSVENRMIKAIDTYNRDVKLLVTFVLSNLNDQQLDEFVNTYGGKLILNLLNDRLRDNWYIQPTWKLIQNKMTEGTFRTLVVEMMRLEQASDFKGCSSQPQNWLFNCSLIWNDIPTNVKQSIVEDILSNTRLFEKEGLFIRSSRRFVGFLLLILSSATFEQRSTFWHDCWTHLIDGTRSEDLLRIMKLCFENEEEIAQFKGRMLTESDNVHHLCSKLLRVGMFDEFNDLLSFYWPEGGQAAKDYKLQLLQSTFLGENCRITRPLAKRANEFSVFIDDIFDSGNQSSEFKNQLMLSTSPRDILSSHLVSLNPSFEAVMELVDTFGSARQTIQVIKMRMISFLAEFIVQNRDNRYFDNRDDRFKTPVFEQFLCWLLESAEEAERFRQSYFA
ncbi:uncharacterized protein LOC135847616 isoform X4 [Planococcus citri]|uniref:uncharacterized protein LOC135847616 isoform X4 n=1 Tax=Planococcus citri TaxID=170843 RepID=UPI0031F8AB77